MTEPSEKSPEVNKFLSGIAGRSRDETIRSNRCMTCGGGASDFKDACSRREYTISGMCQTCQDKVWG